MEIKNVKIDFLGHSGFLISNGKKIAIDPYNVSDDLGKVDIILITHSHYDHCSIKDIEKISEMGTVIICTADSQSKIMKIQGLELQVVEVGDKIELDNITIETVAAYNKNKEFHPKSEGWIGFVVKMNNVIIYHAGDTDFIPEMQKLNGYGKHDNEFIALLPVSGKYVMTAEQASKAAESLSPDLAIPMHYGAGVAGSIDDAEKFVKFCEEKGIKAQILERI